MSSLVKRIAEHYVCSCRRLVLTSADVLVLNWNSCNSESQIRHSSPYRPHEQSRLLSVPFELIRQVSRIHLQIVELSDIVVMDWTSATFDTVRNAMVNVCACGRPCLSVACALVEGGRRLDSDCVLLE